MTFAGNSECLADALSLAASVAWICVIVIGVPRRSLSLSILEKTVLFGRPLIWSNPSYKQCIDLTCSSGYLNCKTMDGELM